MSRTLANVPCENDWEELDKVYRRLYKAYPETKVGDAIAFMQYAAISQLNRNFVVLTNAYQEVNLW